MNYTVITGASSGIGKELAKIFAKNGHSLILIARREGLLKDLKEDLKKYKVDVVLMPYDLTNDLNALYEQLNLYTIDVLINNAGYGLFEEFQKSDLEKNLNMVDLNIKALVSLCHFYVQKEKSGHIINIASVASFVPGPFMSVYYATKAFVLSFSEALSEELKGTFNVTAICPGPTKSEFAKVAHMEKAGFFNSIFARSSEDVANYTYKCYLKKKVVGIDGFFNRIGLFMVRFLPRSVVSRALKIIQGSTNTKV